MNIFYGLVMGNILWGCNNVYIYMYVIYIYVIYTMNSAWYGDMHCNPFCPKK